MMFGRLELKHAVRLENRLAIRTMRRRTTRSGLEEMPKESKIHAHCSFDTPEFVAWPSVPTFTSTSRMRIYQTFSISSLLEPQTLLKVNLPSCLSNLYESLTASLKERVSLICHTVMKRGRPSSLFWQWGKEGTENARKVYAV
ncbi:uncharacterized protein LACBIDRAFT_299272 [Laccaria bicolor S238N-H82]|nr:uncharacterized protein LACBIDRAFT_299272 [Laccaria bicolor S238N-H82]EDR07020.1 predicted protein [Laccaria bicolor S238N-H82]|eukprot:XP_001882393.1 predicted protein [Laccaria bicolor S238N-H82]